MIRDAFEREKSGSRAGHQCHRGLVHDAIGCSADGCELATGLCQDGVTPCGYSPVFTDTVQMPKVPDTQFVPIANP
jgi:hypothetical protein